MGSFLFKWSHSANEVFVTGTFDDWAKSVKLDKTEGTLFQKSVDLPLATEKIYYKFVVDDIWTTDHTAPQETDSAGNVNNVLRPEDIQKAPNQNSSNNMSDPVEKTASSDLPGAFPETPAAQEMSVNPLPATSGMGNPVNLKAGEKVPDPSSFTSNTIDSHVTTDKASYENSSGAPQLPDVITPQQERGTGMFGLPEKSDNMIPESSLPMGSGKPAEENDMGPFIRSAGAGTTTAELAGKVPLEQRGVPEIVQESQKEAKFDPEASAYKEMVSDKSAMEKELESKVPEEPVTSEGTSTGQVPMSGESTEGTSHKDEGIAGAVLGGVAGAGAAAAAATGLKSDNAETSKNIPSSVQNSINDMNKSGSAIAPTVPDVVQESIAEAHLAPEAAGITEMVKEKSAMEAQLLDKVKTEERAGEPAPTMSAALSETAPSATGGASNDAKPSGEVVAGGAMAGATMADTGSKDNAAVPTDFSSNSKSTEQPLSPPAHRSAMASAMQAPRMDSRDVSPMTRVPGQGTESQTQPTVTTGVGSSKAPEISQPVEDKAATETPSKAPAKNTPMSAKSVESSTSAGASSKKSKRSSGFFGKLKDKFKHKKEEGTS